MLRDKSQKYFLSGYGARRLKGAFGSILFMFLFWIFSFAQDYPIYDTQGKRNPFIPLVTPDGRLLKLDKEQRRGDLWVEGIIYDKHGRSYAIVNSAIVGIGDKIGDYQVLKIEKNKVIFIKEGQTKEVNINKEE